MNSPNDGRFYATGPTVKMLLQMAYGVQDAQIVGAPAWINSEHFDIQAKADSATDEALRKLAPAQAKLVKEHMLQALLADRFGLKLHHETRQLPVYALVVAKNGPKLEEAKDDAPPHPEAAPVRADPGGPGAFRGVRMRVNGGEQHLEFQDSQVGFLTQLLAQFLGRTVADKTGLTKRYNFKLDWAGGGMPMGGPGPAMMGDAGPGPVILAPGGGGGGETLGAGLGGMGARSSPDASGPSIFTALQEQLGLKLKSEKGPVDVLVIDHVEPPTAN